MTLYDVSHRTTYHYGQPVSISHHVLHLTPRACTHQTCHRTALSVNPTPSVCTQDTDYFGNPQAFLALQDQHMNLGIHVRSVIEVREEAPPEPAKTTPWDEIPKRLLTATAPEDLRALEYSFDSPYTRYTGPLEHYARASFTPGRPILEAATELMSRIHKEFAYDGTATTVSTPVDEVFRIRRGVCQDFAHLQLACLRALGLPGRYVSGYLMTHPPAGQEKLVGADASHAWLSVWCPGHGWVDLDPTNDMIPTTEHITLAWGRDYGDVSPINGVIYGGGQHSIEVAVDVIPVKEVPADTPAA